MKVTANSTGPVPANTTCWTVTVKATGYTTYRNLFSAVEVTTFIDQSRTVAAQLGATISSITVDIIENGKKVDSYTL